MTDPLVILLIGILIVVGGIIGLRLHPFLALLLGAFVVALMTPAAAIEQYALATGASAGAAQQLAHRAIGERIALQFGSTAGKIGILIAMASIIGKCLLESGAGRKDCPLYFKTDRHRQSAHHIFVEQFFPGHSSVFRYRVLPDDPLGQGHGYAHWKKLPTTGLVHYCWRGHGQFAGTTDTSPAFLASEMNIPIGMMMIGGFLVGLVTIVAGYFFAVWANKKWPVPLRDSIDAPLKEIQALGSQDDAHLPSLWLSLLPILIPLVFISAKSIVDMSSQTAVALDNSGFFHLMKELIQFLGEKNIALVAGGLAGLVMLVKQKKGDKKAMVASVQGALMTAGIIILITAAGGAFGGMLQQTGISARIGALTQNFQMGLLPLAFLVAAVVRTAQGSATVAMITASGILSGMANTGQLEFHPLYIGLAVACGSKLVPWMNDSGFWIVCKMSNLTEKEALKTFSPLLTIMGITGLVVIIIAAKLIPLV